MNEDEEALLMVSGGGGPETTKDDFLFYGLVIGWFAGAALLMSVHVLLGLAWAVGWLLAGFAWASSQEAKP